MKVIPAIDIKNGKCVRLKKGNFSDITIYSGSPLEQARLFKDNGFDFIHVIDLDGAKKGERINNRIIDQIINLDIKIQIGGGIRTISEIKNLFSLGVYRVILGTAVVENTNFLFEVFSEFNNKNFTIALDFRSENNIPFLATRGWLNQTNINLYDFIKSNYIVNMLATDINKDGLMSGPNLEIYSEIKKTSPKINIIGSGGISSIDDIYDLKEISVDECVVGKAIYDKKITLRELSNVN